MMMMIEIEIYIMVITMIPNYSFCKLKLCTNQSFCITKDTYLNSYRQDLL